MPSVRNSPRVLACLLAASLAGSLSAPSAGRAATATTRAGDLARASLFQAGRELILTVRTRRALALSGLQRLADPRRPSARYLCLLLTPTPRTGPGRQRRICLGGRHPRRRAGLAVIDGAGSARAKSTVPLTVTRPRPEKLVVALIPGEADLRPQRYGWRVIASRGCPEAGCASAAPPGRRDGRFRLRPVRVVGCSSGTGLVSHGSRDGRTVALTFDDGPSDYTPSFLQVLREKRVPGTFFEIGQEMPGREATMRQILAAGNEIGSHTMNHVAYPNAAQIGGAAERVAAYTHFHPCLFRPPGGAVDASVIATAGALGLRAVNWDVDPADWSTPGAAAVYSRVVGAARPGSIVLMHDGGGDRSGTLAALPRIIDTLRGRGYRFATVSQLLGGRLRYRPYG